MSYKQNLRFTLILTLVLSLSVGAIEREEVAGIQISGVVLTAEGTPSPGTTVEALSASGVVLQKTKTSPDGSFVFAGVSADKVYVQARTEQQVSATVSLTATKMDGNPVVIRMGAPITTADSKSAGPQPSSLSELRSEMLALQQKMMALQQRLDQLAGGAKTAGGIMEKSDGLSAASVPSENKTNAAVTPAENQEPNQGIYPAKQTGFSLGDKVQIGGYGSFRYEANGINDGPAFGSLPPVQRGFNSFDFRRFVLTLDANPTERLRFYTEIEFERLGEIEVERTAIPENRGNRNRAGVRFIQEIEGQDGSELAMEQAWVQYDFSQYISARMGVILPPVGRFNINHDDDAWDIPRRSLVDRGGPVLPVKAAWSELGAGVLGNVPVGDGFLDYQFYLVNGAQLDFTLEEVVSLREGRNLVELEPEIAFSSGPFNGTNTADALTWRLAYTPRLGHEFALSGYHGEYTPNYLNVNSWISSVALDGKTTLGRVEIEGEFVYTDFGRMEQVLNDIARQAVDSAAKTTSAETVDLETEVEAEFAGPLTNQRYGYWVDLKYRFWPQALNDTFWGKGFENPEFVPVVRFERIWFNDFVRSFEFSGGAITNLNMETLSQQRVSIGLAYRPTPSVGFSFAWENNRRMQGSTLIFPSVLGLGRVPDKTYNALIIGTVFGF